MLPPEEERAVPEEVPVVALEEEARVFELVGVPDDEPEASFEATLVSSAELARRRRSAVARTRREAVAFHQWIQSLVGRLQCCKGISAHRSIHQ